jgi:hypothetical protein
MSLNPDWGDIVRPWLKNTEQKNAKAIKEARVEG